MNGIGESVSWRGARRWFHRLEGCPLCDKKELCVVGSKILSTRASNIAERVSMEEVTDQQLLEKFADTGAMCHFNELVGRHMGKVRAMIYAMVLNNADADDLTQEVFLKAVNGISGFRAKSQFATWVYRIAMNTTHSFLRRKRRNPVDQCEQLPDHADGRPDPERALIALELDREISRVLASLSPGLRSAIVLTAIQGMSVGEAAHAAGCLTATMYWRVHQARKILGEKLKRHLE